MNFYENVMIDGLNKIKSLNTIKSIAFRMHTKDFSDWFGDDRYYLRAEDIDGKVIEIRFPSFDGIESPFDNDRYKGISDSDRSRLEREYQYEQVSIILAEILLSRAYCEKGKSLDIVSNMTAFNDLLSIAALGRKVAPYDGQKVFESSEAERFAKMETYWKDTIE